LDNFKPKDSLPGTVHKQVTEGFNLTTQSTQRRRIYLRVPVKQASAMADTIM
jgi:hypothetical protein